ncbi:MAG: hypothetical protein ACP5I8_13620 [Phycisphaerae bacterium]
MQPLFPLQELFTPQVFIEVTLPPEHALSLHVLPPSQLSVLAQVLPEEHELSVPQVLLYAPVPPHALVLHELSSLQLLVIVQ